jgi:acyl-CoA thioesterase-2
LRRPRSLWRNARVGDLAVDTAVEGTAAGRYRARLSRDWAIWGPNGGYVASVALRAAGAATALRRPATFACQYLNVAAFGSVDLAVETLRASRRAAALRVSMTQEARPILEALVWVVDDGLPGLDHDVAVMPEVRPVGALRSFEELAPPGYPWFPFWNNVESRPVEPGERTQAGTPAYRIWVRYRPTATFADPFVDAARLLIGLDTMMWPAAARGHDPNPPYQAPSMDLAIQFHRAAPASEWLLCDAQSPIGTGGMLGCRSHVWDADGRLLATGTGQLLCRPTLANDG